MKITIRVHLVLSKMLHLEIWPQMADFTTSLLPRSHSHNGGVVPARVLLTSWLHVFSGIPIQEVSLGSL